MWLEHILKKRQQIEDFFRKVQKQREERAIGTGKPALTKASKDKSQVSCLIKLQDLKLIYYK